MSEDIFKFFEGPRKPFGRKPSRSNSNPLASIGTGSINLEYAQQRKRPLRKPKLNKEPNGPVQSPSDDPNIKPEDTADVYQVNHVQSIESPSTESVTNLIDELLLNDPENTAEGHEDAIQVELNKASTSQQPAEPKKKKKTRRKSKGKKKVTQDEDGLDEDGSVQEGDEDVEECDSKWQGTENSKHFPDHMSLEDVTRCLHGTASDGNTYVSGSLRINPHFHRHAFVTMPDDDKGDLLIDGLLDRNRALDGDVVVAVVKPMNQWLKQSEGEPQKTGRIVHILEKVHSRKIVGLLHANSREMTLVPRDPRLPTLRVVNNIPFARKKSQLQLYVGQLMSWKKVHCAYGKLIKALGKPGDLKTESRAILMDHNLDVQPYPNSVLSGLPAVDYEPSAEDLADREDWRKECVFTIDPATAVDLDDAVSCKLLDNGNYEIGVHISDVTHYLQAFSSLDEHVAKRATTVYLTETVHHMLPKELCIVCSLLPGCDKLAFSVIWEMTPDAVPVKHRFAKTVINSCCQLSYDVAQNMIEGSTKGCEFKIHGNHDTEKIIQTVTNLYNLSLKMRKRRFDGGALRIDQPKIYIQMDRISGEPVSFMVEEVRDSNRLIEEFMLIANMTVAKHLFEHFPEFALLRSHRDPSSRILQKTVAMLAKLGINLNAQSAATLQTSINGCRPVNGRVKKKTDTELKMMAINTLCAKTMNRATYICSSKTANQDDLRHYALNVPFYTHFTSPIRRYADCVVHRLLNASLKKHPMDPKWNDSLCSTIANNCNVKKYCAKLAQEQSSELYFAYYLELRGPMETTGVVVEIKRTYLDVILCEIGLKVRLLYIEIEKIATVVNCYKNDIPLVRLIWKNRNDTWQDVSILSILNLKINKHPEHYQVQGQLLPP